MRPQGAQSLATDFEQHAHIGNDSLRACPHLSRPLDTMEPTNPGTKAYPAKFMNSDLFE